MVNRPTLRSGSATNSSATSHATKNPMEYKNPSYPFSAIEPTMPKNDAAER